MLVPNAENAVIDIRKLRDYCLNPNHEIGKHKARIFAAALNLTEKDAPILQDALLTAIKTPDAEIGRRDKYGQRYTVDFEFEWQGRRAVIRGAWIIDSGAETPRFITCFSLWN